jgi:hypothetical protein
MGFELRTSCLLSKHCLLSHVPSPFPFFYFSYFSERVSWLALDHDPPIYAFYVAGTAETGS